MTEASTSTSSTSSNWQAESLRMTAFFAPGAKPETLKTWEGLVGTPPEVSQIQRKDNILLEEGPYQQKTLRFLLHPPRIDWVLLPIKTENQEQEEAAGFTVLGSFDRALEQFCPLMRDWLKDGGSIVRLALGAILLQPVDDRAMGYSRLQPLLPKVTLDPEGSSDFLYQINRPRASTLGIAALRINRLCKWSVAQFQRTAMQLSADGVERVSLSPSMLACRLELDINTTVDFHEILPSDKLYALFEELVKLGQEIANQGDIP